MRGKRLKSNFVKVECMKNGQFRITIPVKVARSQGISGGDVLLVEELFSGGLSLKKVEIIRNGELIK